MLLTIPASTTLVTSSRCVGILNRTKPLHSGETRVFYSNCALNLDCLCFRLGSRPIDRIRHCPCKTICNGNRHTPINYRGRSEEHTSELQSLMRISYAVFCLKKKNSNK